VEGTSVSVTALMTSVLV